MKEKLTEAERKERLEQAEQTVRKHSYEAALAGAVPIPLVDLIILTGVQLKMVAALARLFDTEFQGSVAKAVISSLVGSAAVATVMRPLASLIKVVPGIGSVAGAVTVGGLGSAATYSLGKVFIEHFDSGGTILTLNPEKVRDYYREQTREAPKITDRGMP